MGNGLQLSRQLVIQNPLLPTFHSWLMEKGLGDAHALTEARGRLGGGHVCRARASARFLQRNQPPAAEDKEWLTCQPQTGSPENVIIVS